MPEILPAAAPPRNNAKIFLGIVLLILAGGGIYYWSNRKSTTGALSVGTPGAPGSGAGNDYVSAAAIAKKKSFNYAPYTEPTGPTDGNYNGFNGAVTSMFGQKKNTYPGDTLEWNGVYGQGFMKGMNVALSASNANIFKPFIDEYLKNPNHKPHWEVQVGEFLT